MESTGSSGHGTFGTLMSCIDGRVGEAIRRWLKEHFPEIQYWDNVLAPGIDGLLAGMGVGTLTCDGFEMLAADRLSSIKLDATISLSKHNSQQIIIVGHHDCAGNPVSRAEHLEQIKKSVEVVRSWGGAFATLPIRCLFVEFIDGEWTCEECDVTIT
jgi:hypothetical protein